MCSNSNTLWARNYFNKVAAIHLGITLHAVRHTWIGYGRRLCAAFVNSQDEQFKRLITNANARMSVHNTNQERLSYAGEDGAFQGFESTDRAAYRAISMNFNEKLFGQSGKRTIMPNITSVPSQASFQDSNLAVVDVPLASTSTAAIDVTYSCHVPSIDEIYGSLDQIDEAVIDWDAEYQLLCASESATATPVDLVNGSDIPAKNMQQQRMQQQDPDHGQQQRYQVDQRRAQVQDRVFAAVRDGLSTLVVQQAGFGKTYMCMRLLSQLSFVIFLVPTNQLLKQMAADIKQLGYSCKIWGPDDQSKADTWNIVSGNAAVVSVFDHMHEMASVAKVAKESRKNVIIVVDEAHQLLKDTYYRSDSTKCITLKQSQSVG
jgi:hypothetical protein